MQPTATQRIYSNINTASMAAGSSGRYSPTGGYRTRIATARAAQAALAAEIDVKNVHMSSAASMLRSTDMFTNYHAMASTAAAGAMDFDFATNSLVPSSSNATTATMLMDPAESMASLMAMQHHYHQQQHHQQQQQQQQQQQNQHQVHHFGTQYPMSMTNPSFATIQTSASSAATSSASTTQSLAHCLPPPFPIPLVSTSSSASSAVTAAAAVAAAASVASGCQVVVPMNLHQNNGNVSSTTPSQLISRYPIMGNHIADLDTDPRELERFAEHFKQRRIKLGVTQADVGKALAHLKMPGVGSLSQSTICRFESLTLSHNNMVALKPILHSWLEKAEDVMKKKDGTTDANCNAALCMEAHGILPNSEKKRKRTSIAAPEKRLLEDFFRQQPRPTGDRISAIAEKLDLKKNVVRVWFCNQRQKQKRSQFRTRNQGGNSGRSGGVSSSSSESNHQTNISAATAAAAVAAAAIANHSNLAANCPSSLLIPGSTMQQPTSGEDSPTNAPNEHLEIVDTKCPTLPTFAELSVEAIVGVGGMLANDSKQNMNSNNTTANGLNLCYHCNSNGTGNENQN